MLVWRICRERYAADPFSGEGARRYAARWNPAGVPMVYTSLSLSLACIEVFVHLTPDELPEDLVSISAELPVEQSRAHRVELSELPPDWRRLNHPELQALGAAWARSRRSLELLVPSASVDGEWNALLNPAHPEIGQIRIVETRPFRFDSRMFRR